jgi:putative tricarboxylic transport membrane protein
MISAEGKPAQFAAEFLSSPLSAVILAALLLTILSQTAWWRRWRGTA